MQAIGQQTVESNFKKNSKKNFNRLKNKYIWTGFIQR